RPPRNPRLRLQTLVRRRQPHRSSIVVVANRAEALRPVHPVIRRLKSIVTIAETNAAFNERSLSKRKEREGLVVESFNVAPLAFFAFQNGNTFSAAPPALAPAHCARQ